VEQKDYAMTGSTLKRFLKNIDVIEGSNCIVWNGRMNPAGYGKISMDSVDSYAHRFSYIHCVGIIPDGFVIDHICRNKRCVNPAHLRAVTRRENNVFNSDSAAAKNLVKTHCENGHEFTPENTAMIRPDTPNSIPSRRCRECKKIRRKNNIREDRNGEPITT
jgi:hypothetical protein